MKSETGDTGGRTGGDKRRKLEGRNELGEGGVRRVENDCQDGGRFFLFRRESGSPIRV